MSDAKDLLKQIDHAYDHQPEKLPSLAYQAIIELMKVVKENDELNGATRRAVEDSCVQRAWEVIEMLDDPSDVTAEEPTIYQHYRCPRCRSEWVATGTKPNHPNWGGDECLHCETKGKPIGGDE